MLTTSVEKYQFSSVAQSCPTLCNPINCSTPGLPVHHELPEHTQTDVHWSVMPSNHLILCRPLLLLFSVFPSIMVFSSELTLPIRWPKCWTFSFSIPVNIGFFTTSAPWKAHVVHVKRKSACCVPLCDPMDSTVYGILQARILERVAFPFSRGSSQPRNRIQASHIAGRLFTTWATREAPCPLTQTHISPYK